MINATFNNMQATSWSSDLFGTAKERNKETGLLKWRPSITRSIKKKYNENVSKRKPQKRQ